jgi:glycosyltransferase involved in cell wall biosynthesis
LDHLKNIKDKLNIHDVNLYVLHGEMTPSQLAALYSNKKVIAQVSFTHGEGAGLPLLEASLCGLPLIVSNWSGLLDYVDSRAILLPGTVSVIGKELESEYFPKGSSWFTVDYNNASQVLEQFYTNDRTKAKDNAISLATSNAKKFSLAAFDTKFHGILNKYLGTK